MNKKVHQKHAVRQGYAFNVVWVDDPLYITPEGYQLTLKRRRCDLKRQIGNLKRIIG